MQGLGEVVKKVAGLPGVVLQLDGRRQTPLQVAEQRLKHVDEQLISRFCSIVVILEAAAAGKAPCVAVFSGEAQVRLCVCFFSLLWQPHALPTDPFWELAEPWAGWCTGMASGSKMRCRLTWRWPTSLSVITWHSARAVRLQEGRAPLSPTPVTGRSGGAGSQERKVPGRPKGPTLEAPPGLDGLALHGAGPFPFPRGRGRGAAQSRGRGTSAAPRWAPPPAQTLPAVAAVPPRQLAGVSPVESGGRDSARSDLKDLGSASAGNADVEEASTTSGSADVADPSAAEGPGVVSDGRAAPAAETQDPGPAGLEVRGGNPAADGSEPSDGEAKERIAVSVDCATESDVAPAEQGGST